MKQTDELYRAFLEEMQELENFRMAYASLHPGVQLEREDPDVRRMIEAMALFSARTRTSALRNILAASRRLFQQFFTFLLTPLPAMAMLEAKTTGRLSEPVMIPRDTEIVVEAAAGVPAIFRTTRDLRILPIRIGGVDMLLRPRAGYRLILHFQSAHARNDEIGLFTLNLNHLNNYQASLQVLHALRDHLEGASVFFDQKVEPDATGTPLEVSFGAPPDPEPSLDQPHPLERVRSYFHFPEQDLFVSFKVPRPPRNWKGFTIALDLDARWPKGLRLNEDVFRFGAVPIENIRKAMAQPLACDGTQDTYGIRHPEAKLGYALQSILGVYEITKEGLVPLRPGTLAGGAGSFEVERGEAESGAETARLRLRLPEAFQTPKKIAVEAYWFQPAFSQKTASKLDVSFYDREVAGVELELQGDIRTHLENPLRNDADGLLQVLALKNKTLFSLDDVGILLNALGSVRTSPLKGVPELFQGLEVSTVPLAREGISGMKHIFRFELREFDPRFRPYVEVALRQIGRCLDVWIADATIEVTAVVPATGETLTILGQA